MKSFFFPFVVALIVVGAIDSTITLAALTPSQLLTAVAVVVLVAVFGVIVAAATGVAAPQLSTLTRNYCLGEDRRGEVQKRQERNRMEINWWDAEHIAIGYLGG